MKKRITLGLIAFQMIALHAIATIVINFDTDALGNPIIAPSLSIETTRLDELYASLGVHFWGTDGPNGNNGGGIFDQDANFGIDAHSGRNVLGFNRDPAAFYMDGGRLLDPETITFDSLAAHVSIFAAGGTRDKTFLMQGFDINGVLVASDTLTTQQWGELEIGSLSGIKSVQLSCLDPAPNTFYFVFDDLSVDFVPEPSITSFLICTAALGVAVRLRKKRP